MTITLRYYQQEAIEALYDYFRAHNGHPIIDLPTGSGKSLVIGGFCARTIGDYPATRILVLAHRKELLKQNAEKIGLLLPGHKVALWSAGLNRYEKGQITVAGIQSVYKQAAKLAPIDLLLVDECHLISNTEGTMYRKLIDGLRVYDKTLKVIGFSATPYRTGTGMLTDGKDRIFTDIAYSADTGRLIREGYLCPLVSKAGKTRADLSGLHTRGGEFIPAELADRMDKWELIDGACREIISYGHDRKSWLLFCSGVQHAEHVAQCLQGYGVRAAMICGDTPAAQRDAILEAFKRGEIQAVTNADVLTTGFDHPGISLIAMLRPTKSVGLYIQILGRGLRLDPGKRDCLVLDYAGNVARFGPIDAITITRDKAGKAEGVSVCPAKECPKCQALVHPMLRECDQCGHLFEFEERAKHGTEADDAPLVAGLQPPQKHKVTAVHYYRHAQPGKPVTLRVAYWCGRCGMEIFNQYVPIEDPRAHMRKHAAKWFWARGAMPPNTVAEALEMVHALPKPVEITVRREGKYWNVVGETFDRQDAYELMTRGG